MPAPTIPTEDRLQQAIDRLQQVVGSNPDAAGEIAVVRQILQGMRDANENLVLATVKAQALQEEADLRNRRQTEFLAMLAHELRNPMAPIRSAAELLGKITAAHPLLPKVQQIVDRQVGHMARLLDDLLDASRISSGKISLRRAIVPLEDVLAHALEVSKPFIERRQQHLECQMPGTPVYVDGDSVRLSQVFSNLLINASKYSPDKGNISLQTRLVLDSVVITVRDDGRGIDPELLPHVFELFVQGDRSLDRTESGLGIGLSIARGITEMHGGRITARSDGAGTGASFEVMLPLAKLDAPDAGNLSGPSLSERGCRRRILVIEDNADFASTLSVILELEGHFVQHAADGLSGLALAQDHAFDLILCDIGVPRLNGYDLIAQLRKQMAHPRPRAIAMSGYSQPEDRQRALDAGFDDYLVKPFPNSRLLELLRV